MPTGATARPFRATSSASTEPRACRRRRAHMAEHARQALHRIDAPAAGQGQERRRASLPRTMKATARGSVAGFNRREAPTARRSILVWNSPASNVSSPTLIRSRSIVASRSSSTRDLRVAAPTSRNASRQLRKSAAVAANSRTTIAKGSPRTTRSTASRLRPAVMRRSRPVAASPPMSRSRRARGSAALNVIHRDTSVGSDRPSWLSQGTPRRWRSRQPALVPRRHCWTTRKGQQPTPSPSRWSRRSSQAASASKAMTACATRSARRGATAAASRPRPASSSVPRKSSRPPPRNPRASPCTMPRQVVRDVSTACWLKGATPWLVAMAFLRLKRKTNASR